MTRTNKKLIVVLGMHRSGTSVLARALQVFNVALGENLAPAAADNPKGFWEDQDIKEFNIELLSALSMNWSTLSLITQESLVYLKEQGYIEKALALLERKLQPDTLWGVKEPRQTKLLAFWLEVFKLGDFDVRYIITVRDPKSVALSLEKRNHFSHERSYLLWLEHLLNSLYLTQGEKRVLVDYGQMLQNPDKQLDRVADTLALTVNDAERAFFIAEFLDTKLQHANGVESSIPSDHDLVFSFAHEIYRALLRQIDTKEPLSESKIEEKISEWYTALSELKLSHAFVGKLDADFLHAQRKIEEKDLQLLEQYARILERNEFIEKLREQLSEYQTTIASKDIEIHRIKSDKFWRASQLLTRLKDKLFPKGSFFARLIDNIIRLLFSPLFWYQRVRDIRLIRNSAYFNPQWYLEQNTDVTGDPVRHYYKKGVLKGLDPSPEFSTSRYLSQYPDIALTEQNPLAHYLRVGQYEGREIYPSGQAELFHSGIQSPKPHAHVPLHRRIYQVIYKYFGAMLRRFLSPDKVEQIKEFIPALEGIPKKLYPHHTPYQQHKPVSDEFLPLPPDASPDIFVFSIIHWDFRHQRPQHIAEGLANTGRRVFYIEQNMSPAGLEIKQTTENLYIVRLSARYSGVIPPYKGRPDSQQTQQWLHAFYEFLDIVKASSFKQIIIQHPFWWQLVRHLSPEFQVIYDCMDDIVEFSNTEPFIVSLEYDLLEKCDSLVVSSQHLYNKYRKYTPPTLIRNAADIKHFLPQNQNKRRIPQNFQHLEESSRIKVGYVGAISDWFDVELIKKAALLDKSIEYHLCGGITNKLAVQLGELENITLYGEIPYQDVPPFLELIDIATIPFLITPIIEACDPVKFYEYSAIGKPTVATALPELERASELIFTATTPQEMVDKIHQAFEKGKSDEFIRSVQAYAQSNTWKDRVDDFLQVLYTCPKVSVIILAYGPAILTRAAIASLYDAGATYPNLETLIIDNGSSAEAISELQQLTTQYPNVRLIQNGKNLGFAKGNNVGLREATGDYVMLLNNDTEVAPGAIFSLVRHLQQNAEIGAVGPLTNNIGNEAKLFVEYTNSEEMKQIARKVTTGYRGIHTEIPVLAYFAVMFRKADLEEFGLLSEDYGYGMFEDDDHCAIIKSKGYRCALAEDAFVHHQLSATFSERPDKKALFEQNKAVFEAKWGIWQPHKYRDGRPVPSFDKAPIYLGYTNPNEKS